MTTRSLTREILGAAALAALLCIGPIARADDASEAQLHHELGRELYRQRRYAEALDQFLASNRLVPNRNVVFNIAQTHQLLGRERDAYNWYETYLRDFELSEDERAEGEAARDTLGRRLPVLEIASDPAGATIYVDREDLGAIGTTPRRVAVEPGAHAVLLHREGYHGARVEVVATVATVSPASATLERIVATLEVVTTPAGARVARASGEVLGTTPLTATLPVGDVDLVIELDGYVTDRRSVLLREDAPSRLEVPLARDAARFATVSVVVDPAGARVELDGEPIGTAPFTRDALEPGRRRITISASGRSEWSEEIVLEAGAATRVRASLTDPSSAPWEGWAWIGYGVGGASGAAAIVVGAVALVLEGALDADPNPSRSQIDAHDSLALAADVLGALAAATLGVTFVWDLATGPPPPSRGSFELER